MLVIIVVAVVGLVAYFFLRNTRHSVALPPEITTAQVTDILNTHIAFFQNLDTEGKTRFEALVETFLSEVIIEGVGTEITNVDRAMIASSAIIPIFGFPEWKYTNLTNIVLYPGAFNNDFEYDSGTRDMTGLVGGGFMNGQMLLSRAALIKGFSKNNGKENTAIHEFVHLLDSADGATDGVPDALLPHEYATPWLQMIHKEMHRIKEGRSDIDPYAITNEAEFLAVTSEYFFEKPNQFKDKHPELYQQLSMAFNQNPAN